jgi:transposase-like protein
MTDAVFVLRTHPVLKSDKKTKKKKKKPKKNQKKKPNKYILNIQVKRTRHNSYEPTIVSYNRTVKATYSKIIKKMYATGNLKKKQRLEHLIYVFFNDYN